MSFIISAGGETNIQKYWTTTIKIVWTHSKAMASEGALKKKKRQTNKDWNDVVMYRLKEHGLTWNKENNLAKDMEKLDWINVWKFHRLIRHLNTYKYIMVFDNNNNNNNDHNNNFVISTTYRCIKVHVNLQEYMDCIKKYGLVPCSKLQERYQYEA